MSDPKTMIQQQRREQLRNHKPLVYEKIVRLSDRIGRGEFLPLIAIAYDTVCNLKCKHCCIDNMRYDAPALTVDDIRSLATQADTLGIAQVNLAGGEPLMFRDFDAMIQALGPDRFYIGLDTNGLLITEGVAQHLMEIGVDKVKISIDDIEEDVHNENRNAKVYQRAIAAVFTARRAGLHAIVNTVATSENIRNGHMERLAQFGQENDIDINVLVLVAMGKLDGQTDLQITEDDTRAMWQISQKYPVFHRDIFGAYGIDYGCKAGNINIYITKYGEAYPCYGLPITFGNVKEDRLSEILRRMARVRWFREPQLQCLCAENKPFIAKYLTPTFGRIRPVWWEEVFTGEDLADSRE